MTSPYDVLGIPQDADDEAIQAAFRKAAKIHHPDLNAGDETAAQRFKQIAAARDAILKDREPEAGLAEDVAFDHTLLDDHYVRRKRRVIHASGVICALAAAWLISGTLSLRSPLTAVASGSAGTYRLIAAPVPPNTELHPDRAIAYASDKMIWDVAARGPEVDFPRSWPETQGLDGPDAAAGDRVNRTSTVQPMIWPAPDGRWWALPYRLGAATSLWPSDDKANVPTPKAAKKPNPPRGGHSAEGARAIHAAAVSRRTRASAGASRADRAAAAASTLRLSDGAGGIQRPMRPAYTLHGCWTDDGNGRWWPCGGGG